MNPNRALSEPGARFIAFIAASIAGVPDPHIGVFRKFVSIIYRCIPDQHVQLSCLWFSLFGS